VQRRLHHYGFAFLVLVGLVCASYLAGSAEVPESVPDFALRSAEIYRLEIGMAFFVAFYLVTMVFLLALRGKGFAELGTRGLKAETVVVQQRSASRQEQINRRIRQTLDAHEQRLEKLEADRYI